MIGRAVRAWARNWQRNWRGLIAWLIAWIVWAVTIEPHVSWVGWIVTLLALVVAQVLAEAQGRADAYRRRRNG